MKFDIVTGRVNITDARLDKHHPNSNLWEIKAKKGTWIVNAPESCSYLKATHISEKPASKNDSYDSISIDCGMIAISDSDHYNDQDANALREMIDDDFGHCLLLTHGILVGTIQDEGVYEVYARINQVGEVVAIFIDFDPEEE